MANIRVQTPHPHSCPHSHLTRWLRPPSSHSDFTAVTRVCVDGFAVQEDGATALFFPQTPSLNRILKYLTVLIADDRVRAVCRQTGRWGTRVR